MMLTPEFVNKMREVIADYDRRRESAMVDQGYQDAFIEADVVEVRITGAPGTGTGTGSGSGTGTDEPNEGVLYTGVITSNLYEDVWQDGQMVYVKMMNDTDTVTLGNRYSCRFSHTALDGGMVLLATSSAKAAGGGGGGSGIEIKEADGSPDYTGVTVISFDQTQGFVLTQPGGAGTGQISIANATTGSPGVVSLTSQVFAGLKTFQSGVTVSGGSLATALGIVAALNGDVVITNGNQSSVYSSPWSSLASGGSGDAADGGLWVGNGVAGSYIWWDHTDSTMELRSQPATMGNNVYLRLIAGLGSGAPVLRIKNKTSTATPKFSVSDSGGDHDGVTGTLGPGAASTGGIITNQGSGSFGDALTSGTLAQFAATTSAQLAGVISDETGTGKLVFGTSPTLVTPDLGTPTAAMLTNATGLPISTGVSGLASGAATFLATPSSANLLSLLTTSTGTGNVVFSASPALTGTPTAPTASAGTNTTQIATTAFVSAAVTTAVTGLLNFKGSTDCSASPNYPAAVKGDSYIVSVAGKIGGASGTSVDVGDWYLAIADNAGGTEASVGSSWGHMEHNLVGALLASNNLSDLGSASTARTNLGLAAVAASGSASDLGTGTLPNARLSTVPNSALANSSVTVTAGTGLTGGGAVALGASITLIVAYGTSSTTACVGNDSRLSDSRAPTGSAGGDLTGTYPNPTLSVTAVNKAFSYNPAAVSLFGAL